MLFSSPTVSTDVSPGLQEAVFRHVLPVWLRRWPGLTSCLLAVGAPLDARPASEEVVRRLSALGLCRMAAYHKEELPRAGLLLGVTTSAPALAAAAPVPITVWGIADNVAGRMGRLFRTERLEFAREGQRSRKARATAGGSSGQSESRPTAWRN